MRSPTQTWASSRAVALLHVELQPHAPALDEPPVDLRCLTPAGLLAPGRMVFFPRQRRPEIADQHHLTLTRAAERAARPITTSHFHTF